MKALLIKHKWLFISAALVLALLLAAVWYLLVAVGEFNAAKKDLHAVSSRLDQLQNRNPFPSPENVILAEENYNELLDNYNELNDRLREGQALPRAMGDSDFIPLLENTLRRLRADFAKKRVALPKEFTFGFDKYAGGQMPASRDIPRLAQQLQIIETLCAAVTHVRITELKDLTREEFESSDDMGDVGGRRGRTRSAAPSSAELPDTDENGDLFKSQQFSMTLRGSESSIMEFVNYVSSMPMFTVITLIDLKNSRPILNKTLAAAGTGAKEKTEEAILDDTRTRPVITGREDVTAKVVMDVYQFAPSLPWDNSGPKKGI